MHDAGTLNRADFAHSLVNPEWSRIARLSLQEVKGYMLDPYRKGAEFFADDYDQLFDVPGRVGSILDFGCGIGRNFPSLRNLCERLYGYDIPEMVSACRRHAGHRAEITGDFAAAAGRTYDLTVASFVFQHIHSMEALRYYVRSLSAMTDYLFVYGRHWRDGAGRENILKAILAIGGFELVRCDPPRNRVLSAGPAPDMHVTMLFRTTEPRLRRPENQRLLEQPRTSRLHFEGYDLLFDRRALRDERGIGRVNRHLLEQLEKSAKSLRGSGGVPEVNFFGSIHWCPDTLNSPSVVLIHDVIPLKYPDLFPEASADWRTRLTDIARQADRIATVSRASAGDIEFHLGIPGTRIDVVPNGIYRLPVDERCGLSLPGAPYIAYVGSSDPHKNAAMLLELLNHPGMGHYSLAMIGRLDTLRGHAEWNRLADRVVFYGRLSDAEAGFVLANSDVLVLPSLYEGFGLPPLEAALVGVPAVCSDRPAMDELLDGCVELVDPHDVEAWAAAITRLRRPDHRRARLAAARKKAQGHSFQDAARAFEEIFRSVAGLAT